MSGFATSADTVDFSVAPHASVSTANGMANARLYMPSTPFKEGVNRARSLPRNGLGRLVKWSDLRSRPAVLSRAWPDSGPRPSDRARGCRGAHGRRLLVPTEHVRRTDLHSHVLPAGVVLEIDGEGEGLFESGADDDGAVRLEQERPPGTQGRGRALPRPRACSPRAVSRGPVRRRAARPAGTPDATAPPPSSGVSTTSGGCAGRPAHRAGLDRSRRGGGTPGEAAPRLHRALRRDPRQRCRRLSGLRVRRRRS